MPRKKSNRRGRPTKLAKLSASALMQELDRRKGMLGDMQKRRAALADELAAIDAEIASLGGTANGQAPPARGGSAKVAKRGRPGRRGPRENSLPAVLHRVLHGRTMSGPEMTQAAKKAGHKSKSKDFSKVVARTVLKNRHLFRRVSRGQYTAK